MTKNPFELWLWACTEALNNHLDCLLDLQTTGSVWDLQVSVHWNHELETLLTNPPANQ